MVTASSAPRVQHATPTRAGLTFGILIHYRWLGPPGHTQRVVVLFYRRQVVHRVICTIAEVHQLLLGRSKLEPTERTSCVLTTYLKLFLTQFEDPCFRS